MALAEYYVSKRNIPAQNIVALKMPLTEEISRSQYNNQIRNPLRAELQSRGLVEFESADVHGIETTILAHCKIKYVVSMLGVPLRIKDTRAHVVLAIQNRMGIKNNRDTAAVDSELSVLFKDSPPLKGHLNNPFYDGFLIPDPGPKSHDYLIVNRLDAPTPHLVKAMIDHAIHGERYGIQGRVYVDTQGLRVGEYLRGDSWLIRSSHALERQGYDVYQDRQRGTIPIEFPMEDPAIYLGWYAPEVNGPFLRPEVQFRPGALAYHLHSFSAETLRSSAKNWVGPLLSRGATSSLGCVSEPYLALTPDVGILINRLLFKMPLGDAAFMANQAFSWQTTVIGDPLYRPFRFDVEQQIEHIKADNYPGLEHAYVRKINLLVMQGRLNVALNFARQRLLEMDSPVLREKLADLYVKNGMYDAGWIEYQRLFNADLSLETITRIGAKVLFIFKEAGNEEQLKQIWKSLKEVLRGSELYNWLVRFNPELAAS